MRQYWACLLAARRARAAGQIEQHAWMEIMLHGKHTFLVSSTDRKIVLSALFSFLLGE
jgi:hypothetical protein